MKHRMFFFHAALVVNLLLWLGVVGISQTGQSASALLGTAIAGLVVSALLQHWAYRNLRHPQSFARRGPASFTLDPRSVPSEP